MRDSELLLVSPYATHETSEFWRFVPPLGILSCRAAELPSCRVAELPSCRVAELPSCRAAGHPLTSAPPEDPGYYAAGLEIANRGALEVVMKTQGEIEAAICEGVGRFEQEYMGRGPKDIRTHLLGDLLVVRLQGVLTAAEQQLVKTLPAEKGRGLLKQVRTQLVETARPALEAMVQDITGVKVVSLHHDISTLAGEEVVLFTLAEAPVLREPRRG